MYAEHVAQYTDPLVQRLASSPYYKAACEHIKPAHMAVEPAEGVAPGQAVDEAAEAAAIPAPAHQ